MGLPAGLQHLSCTPDGLSFALLLLVCQVDG